MFDLSNQFIIFHVVSLVAQIIDHFLDFTFVADVSDYVEAAIDDEDESEYRSIYIASMIFAIIGAVILLLSCCIYAYRKSEMYERYPELYKYEEKIILAETIVYSSLLTFFFTDIPITVMVIIVSIKKDEWTWVAIANICSDIVAILSKCCTALYNGKKADDASYDKRQEFNNQERLKEERLEKERLERERLEKEKKAREELQRLLALGHTDEQCIIL